MTTEIPVQAVIERYKQENANTVQRAIIAETAQEILEQQVGELRQLNAALQQQNEAQAAQITGYQQVLADSSGVDQVVQVTGDVEVDHESMRD